MKPLISIEAAAKALFSSLTPSDTESVSLADAFGRVLRESLTADRPIPPFDRVMMDGIAIDSSEFHGIGTEFLIVGTQAAGSPPLEKTQAQTCFEVMTGAILPHGCDCVIPVEEISITQDSVILSPDAVIEAGHYIHSIGSDSAEGSVLLKANTRLGPAEIAIAASVGKIQLDVSKLPRITLLTSGDEVIPPSQTPQNFEIRSSHPSFLIHLIESNTLGTCQHVHLPDDRSITSEAIHTALQNSDILIFTGGISKGKFDYIAPELSARIGEPLFHGVKQRPGKPFACWHDAATSTSVFALPGNPVSVCATATRYLLPALIQHLTLSSPIQHVKLAHPFHWKPPIPGFAPCSINNDQTATIHQMQNSGDYLCLAGCHGFVYFSQPQIEYAVDTELPFYPFLIK